MEAPIHPALFQQPEQSLWISCAVPSIAMLDQADSTHEVVDSIAAPIVGVRHISKAFGPIVALKNVSLDVGAGEIRGICGENGAGKSTLVKILTGVYRPDEATFSSTANSVSSRRHARRRSTASPLSSQELSLCPDLSVEDNIWLGSLRVPFLHKRPACGDAPRTRWRSLAPPTFHSIPPSAHLAWANVSSWKSPGC